MSQGLGARERTRFTRAQMLLRLTFPESGPNCSHAETQPRKPLNGAPPAHPKGRAQANITLLLGEKLLGRL